MIGLGLLFGGILAFEGARKRTLRAIEGELPEIKEQREKQKLTQLSMAEDRHPTEDKKMRGLYYWDKDYEKYMPTKKRMYEAYYKYGLENPYPDFTPKE